MYDAGSMKLPSLSARHALTRGRHGGPSSYRGTAQRGGAPGAGIAPQLPANFHLTPESRENWNATAVGQRFFGLVDGGTGAIYLAPGCPLQAPAPFHYHYVPLGDCVEALGHGAMRHQVLVDEHIPFNQRDRFGGFSLTKTGPHTYAMATRSSFNDNLYRLEGWPVPQDDEDDGPDRLDRVMPGEYALPVQAAIERALF